MTGFTGTAADDVKASDHTNQEFIHHSQGQRVNTDAVVVNALRHQYPELQVTVCEDYACPLLQYAAAGHATIEPIEDAQDPFGQALKWRHFLAPPRRTGAGAGVLINQVKFGKYMYKFKKSEFIIYTVNGRDGSGPFTTINNYIVSNEPHAVDELIATASKWQIQLHQQVWVFDGGIWRKSADLWNSVQNSKWENVILDEERKRDLIDDAEGFFNSQDEYKKLQVPWKRGIIYYGPPGNGKTISIKAMMRSLSRLADPIPTLYVRSLSSIFGPEYSISQIFLKARYEAPCYLVFEDLDSLVTDRVRSYFLNEVDGLKSNDGILMVGSTNHLERLDPGISKRPSRFDRKYEFPNPAMEQRVAYAKFWQKKLSSNQDIKFPDDMCPAIAKITDGFSFAYMQEAFIAALLILARRKNSDDVEKSGKSVPIPDKFYRPGTSGGGGGGYENLPLWKELKRQISILREGIEDAESSQSVAPLNKSPSETSSQITTGVNALNAPFLPEELNSEVNSLLTRALTGLGANQAHLPVDVNNVVSHALGRLEETFRHRRG